MRKRSVYLLQGVDSLLMTPKEACKVRIVANLMYIHVTEYENVKLHHLEDFVFISRIG